MATIEPRLIHLLNEPLTSEPAGHDLPPLSALPLEGSADGPLPRIETDRNHRIDGQTHGPGTPSGPSKASTSAYYYCPEDDSFAFHPRHTSNPREATFADYKPYKVTSAHSIHMLLTENEDDHVLGHQHCSEASDDLAKKKRSRGLVIKDDYVQLPQPLKKQKATQQAPVMPPIIIGLHEPPPHAALFPPIASNRFDESDVDQRRFLQEMAHADEERSDGSRSRREISDGEPESSAPKSRKRASKPRRKWSEKETNHLLLGASRHGVGKWTNILEDPEFQFDGRTAGDLKDRFRTCCPDELRKSAKSARRDSNSDSGYSKYKSKKPLDWDSILLDNVEEGERNDSGGLAASRSSLAAGKKSRAHRKKMEDLAELGIHGPFKKSHRRERCPFTEQDDREILEGLELYGPAWTKIQRDPRFHLSNRQPTDLRDRVRNKHAQVYTQIEKGTFPLQGSSRTNNLLEPSVHMSVNLALKSNNQGSRSGSKGGTKQPVSQLPAARPDGYNEMFAQSDYHENVGTHTLGGDMDISRLLLDDNRMSADATRSGHVPEANNSIASQKRHKGR